MREYRVQFANHWSEKNGDQVTDEAMSLADARQWVASHPEGEYVILQRERDAPGAIWTLHQSRAGDERGSVVTLSPRALAEAFSTHEFSQAFTHLAEDVVWILPGDESIVGRAAVIAACEATTEALAGVTVTRSRVVTADGGATVAVDTLTRYRTDATTKTVASCDVYEFEGDVVRAITSYTVEISPEAGEAVRG